ncbi:V-snare-domain-containing protein [Metschnikowia bicuspidata var. bicuspidata NRRL YB-4993]|uniref:Golgi SNAP receptor complex member 1 n=1 Tax=Metschnikowia bicuspidata var. bicuspidata NRRL YB-4993 TaxID=869754 RepID=A0A1A0HAC4_9ASCO|nr:V-snare-domain-containing protein [Metschnikowia bicuspidata var. bicuspidata NRRL YB-4993]OBA20955.1 V-snare-domain-containing protein [Metschnikowia bicuspidata var. bicuspidata NRRL YB-4993]
MSSASFTQTRNSAISFENTTQLLLSRFSKLQQVGHSVEPDAEETGLVGQISDVLAKREDVVARLGRICDSDINISTSKLQQLQRHREILAADRSSFLKIQARINDERNRNNLLFLVQSDISAHKQRNVSLAAENANEYALDEGRRVDAANSFAERLLQQAYETRDELLSQRAFLQNALSRIQGTILTIPGINVLVSRINTRRKRDTMIMATVITLCILGLYFSS